MDEENCTAVSHFILLGFSDAPELRVFPFLLFLSIYGVTVLGNLGVIVLIQISSGLHIPMYFFLSHLPFVDFCYSMIITLKMLANILNEDKGISFLECTVQFYLFCTLVVTEVILLAVMAYDHSVAICDPLLYGHHVPGSLCGVGVLLLPQWCYVFSDSLCLALQVPSYRLNMTTHFFCDLPPLLSPACSDASVNQLMLCTGATFYEIITIMGKCKAFFTCASHLTAITVLQGTALFIYCQTHSGNSMGTDKVTTVFYTVVIPMLNPLIYSLRNKDGCERNSIFKSRDIANKGPSSQGYGFSSGHVWM
uniref:Uncharacterized protein n=1 Tax=Ovis aries TaxID=9940 RepID=A0AC11CXQ5_SHEEP